MPIYRLSPAEKQRFDALGAAIDDLKRAGTIRKGDAFALGEHVVAGVLLPQSFDNNLPIRGIYSKAHGLLFFPDHILVSWNRTKKKLLYSAIQIECVKREFKSFNRVNASFSILTFLTNHGFCFQINTMNHIRACQLCEALNRWIEFVCEKDGDRQYSSDKTAKEGSGTKTDAPSAPLGTSAYEVLRVSLGASPTEVRAAYRRLAQQYHPDKVAGLAPEFVTLAEQRMKEINAAYAALMKPRH